WTSWSLLIDLSEEVGGWRDFGMLGFALDPNFRVNGYLYLMYVVDRHYLMNYGTPNYNPASNEYFAATIGRITRYTARSSDGFKSVDYTSRRVLLGETKSTGFPILYESHGVGSLVFGTDGTLLASCGDGASYSSDDLGSAAETYYSQALADGIIKPKENVGAYRSQLVDSLSGKIVRIDPATGDGIPSNPFYDPANPRAARSRVWALGLRNPCRMTLRPDTGSHLRSDGNPGVLYFGDVGYGTWEDLNVCTGPGRNFGWPAFEGIEVHSGYYGANVANLDAPNPLYPASGCSRYFYFHDLIKQNTSVAANKPPFNNPCNTAQKIPGTIPQFLQTPPAVDWRHGTTLARTWIYNGSGVATPINVGAAGSPVSGSMFPGNCSIGGVWYTGSDFPARYKNTYFHADFGANWVKNFVFDANNNPVSVSDFVTGGGGIVAVATHPIDGGLYYITWSTTVRKISYSSNGNLPPTAVASANRNYGPGPLTVQFTGTGSTDPEGLPLTYNWTFGDGTPNSTAANPSHTFNAPAGVPTPYTVTLKVTDNAGQTSTATLIISLNNTPPTVTITSPVNGSKYPMTGNTVYDLRATVTDAESTDSQLKYEWQTILHHNNHEHQEPVDNNHVTTTVISPVGCDGNTYYYRIVLKVTDPAGLSTQAEADLYPNCANQPPAASFSANPTTGYAPLTVSFDGRSSNDPDGDALTLAWDFGDATGGAGLTPTHTYASVGNYNVVLTVTDSTGRSSTATTTLSVLPVPPPGLDGTYFDNMDLTNPMLTRNDSTINFDWGDGSPDPTIGPDTFSVRWVGKIAPLYSETYTFYALTDDGFRLWVNNQLIIDSWIDQPPTERASTPIALTAGVKYDIRIEYYENGGGAVAKLLWSSPSQPKQIVPAGRLYPPAPVPGLEGTYFDNIDLTNPMLTRNDSTINFDWGDGSPDPAIGPDTFSVRWAGQIEPLYSETYTFYAFTDDGFRLWVNNQIIIDSWIDQPPTEQAGAPIALSAGTRYDIRIEYYENGGGAVAKLLWSSPSQAKEIVPAGRFFPSAAGLEGTYFDNMDLTNPMLTRNDSTIDFDWGDGSPDPAIGPDTFSVRWVGKIEPLYSETYTFYALTDDGFRLWVNNQLIIDSWIDQPPTEQAGAPIALTAGTRYDIRIEYYENGGGAVAKLLWSSPSQVKEIVAAGRLFPPAPSGSPSARKVDPVINWSKPVSIVYGTLLGGSQLNATANTPGTFVYKPPAGTVLKAGSGQTLSLTFTPNDTANYNVATAGVAIDVSKAPLTISANNKTKVYGAAMPGLTASYTGFVNGETAASLDSPVVLSTTANASSPAGSYPITASGAADANYTISFVNGTLTVTPAIKAFVNFQPASSPVPAGYLVDSGQVYGNRGNGFTYGWDASNTSFTRDRNSSLSADQRYDTLNHMQKAGGARVWEIAVPNGAYNVFLVSGDSDYYDSVFRINVEGVLTVSGTPTSSTHWFSGTKTVTVSDGRLSVSNATGGSNNKI
ncbi:MAG: hypothetical protein DME23_16795, partial [Verrucomicrobia bacterium]